jgi:hypothetical protein
MKWLHRDMLTRFKSKSVVGGYIHCYSTSACRHLSLDMSMVFEMAMTQMGESIHLPSRYARSDFYKS